jgi:hypothetical protein
LVRDALDVPIANCRGVEGWRSENEDREQEEERRVPFLSQICSGLEPMEYRMDRKPD